MILSFQRLSGTIRSSSYPQSSKSSVSKCTHPRGIPTMRAALRRPSCRRSPQGQTSPNPSRSITIRWAGCRTSDRACPKVWRISLDIPLRGQRGPKPSILTLKLSSRMYIETVPKITRHCLSPLRAADLLLRSGQTRGGLLVFLIWCQAQGKIPSHYRNRSKVLVRP